MIQYDIDEFYYLARTCLVKDEALYDRFDRVFSAHFKGIEDLSEFLTSQERQSIILHLLSSLRAEKGDEADNGRVKFREGEAIGTG